MTSRERFARLLCLAGTVVVVWAIILAATGGVSGTLIGIHISSRNPSRAAGAGAVLLATGLYLGGIRPRLNEIGMLSRWLRPNRLAAVLAITTVIAGLMWTSRAAGGADSYGYISQVALWRTGHLTIHEPLASQVPWPRGLDTLTPLGYEPSPFEPATIVALYPQGLPLLMSAAQIVAGYCAIFWVVPLLGGVLVFVTFALGRRIGSDWLGLGAAWFLATSPAFLVMIVNPMSDVPAAALWALATFGVTTLSSRSAAAAGLSAGLAVLVRPNLAPLALVLAAWLAWRLRAQHPRRLRPLIVFVLGLLPCIVTLGWFNSVLYGSPLASGYGSFRESFGLDFIAVNLKQWFEWVSYTQTPVAVLGIPALAIGAWPRASRDAQRIALLLIAMLAGVLCAYVAFNPFSGWWFLRYLLPAWPMGCIGLALAAHRLSGGGSRLRPFAVTLAVVLLGVYGLNIAHTENVWDGGRIERRYPEIGRLVHDSTEPNSIVISGQHSGSLRYYAGRSTLRYDQLDTAWLDRAIEWFNQHGIHPYLILDDDERPVFRQLFGATNAAGRLDFAPAVIYKGVSTAYLYDFRNRAPENLAPAPSPLIELPTCVHPLPAPVVTVR